MIIELKYNLDLFRSVVYFFLYNLLTADCEFLKEFLSFDRETEDEIELETETETVTEKQETRDRQR